MQAYQISQYKIRKIKIRIAIFIAFKLLDKYPSKVHSNPNHLHDGDQVDCLLRLNPPLNSLKGKSVEREMLGNRS